MKPQILNAMWEYLESNPLFCGAAGLQMIL